MQNEFGATPSGSAFGSEFPVRITSTTDNHIITQSVYTCIYLLIFVTKIYYSRYIFKPTNSIFILTNEFRKKKYRRFYSKAREIIV